MEKPATADVCTVYEAADRLAVSRTLIYRMCQTGRIPSLKIGKAVRLRRSDVELLAAEGLAAFEGSATR